MVCFLFVSSCIINFIALHSFFFFSARLPLHSPSWPEQHVSNMVLKCRNKHRNFASWGKRFMERTKCLISWLVISAGRGSTLWPCAQRNRASLLTNRASLLTLPFFLTFLFPLLLLQGVAPASATLVLL